jgi:malonate transporter MadM subunit
MIGEHILKVVTDYGLVLSFVYIGAIMWLAYWISKHLTKGRIHGSAIAMILGFIAAYIGGVVTGGSKGIADLALFSGVGTLGGSMFRDYAIISTAFGARISEVKKAGFVGLLAIVIGVITAYIVGALIAIAFGYTDTASITTIGAGTVTFIVGPVTGSAVGASSEVIASASLLAS